MNAVVMNGVVMKKLGLRGKLLLAQLVVLFVSCLAIAAVAIAVAAPLFHNHLMMAGIEDSNVRTHTEEAFAQTMTIALLCGIAVALVVFATWKPTRLLLGAYLFGAVTILQLHAQAFGLGIPSQLMTALPYLATVIVLVLISRARNGGSTAPAACVRGDHRAGRGPVRAHAVGRT